MFKYTYFFIAFILILLLSLPLLLGIITPWGYYWLDFLIANRGGAIANENIALIILDEDSDKKIRKDDKQLESDKFRYRHYHGQLIRNLAKCGVKIIGLDFTFEDESIYDNEFADAISFCKNNGVPVIAGTSWLYDKDRYSEIAPVISPILGDSGIAHLDVAFFASGNIVRGIEPAHTEYIFPDTLPENINPKNFPKRYIPQSLAVAMAMNGKINTIRYEREKFIINDRTSIPTVPIDVIKIKDGRKIILTQNVMLINFVKKPNRDWTRVDKDIAFENFRYYDVLIDTTGNVYRERLKGKYVLIGSYIGEGKRDVYNVPCGLMLGLEIHAHSLNTILNRDFITPVLRFPAFIIVIISVIVALLCIFHFRIKRPEKSETSVREENKTIIKSLRLCVSAFKKCLPVIHLEEKTRPLLLIVCVIAYLIIAFIIFGIKPHYVLPVFEPIISVVIIVVAFFFYKLKRTQETSARYLGLELKAYERLDAELHQDELPRKAITFLFSDVRKYTDFTRDNTPDISARIMRDYYREIGKIVYDYGGYIYYYGGDAILAIYGFPLPDRVREQNQESRALRTAFAIKEFAEKYFKELKDKGKACSIPPYPHIGIGIASGQIHIGNIGIGKRIQMSLIGPIINLASRLQDATKEMKEINCIILMNQEAFSNCKEIIDIDGGGVMEFTTAFPEGRDSKVSADVKNKILYLQGVQEGLKVYAVMRLK